jgi:hypothetical protein
MDIPKLTSVKSAEAAVENILDTYYTTEKNDPSRVLSLRVSSFPFCATKWLLNLRTSLYGVRSTNFIGQFYTGVGTQVHTAFQATLDNSPFVVRDWTCNGCKKRWYFTTKPKSCPTCSSDTQNILFTGHEHEVKIGPIVGHIDDAILLRDRSIEILDYKTTSSSKLASKTDLPNLENVRQIEAYAALKKKQGENISGWSLCYIGRDNGKRRYVHSSTVYGRPFLEEYPLILKRIKTYIRDYKAVSSVSKVSDIKPILDLRRTKTNTEEAKVLCTFCTLRDLCKSDSKMLDRATDVLKALDGKLPVHNWA